ncbi:hypothetical protein J4214_03030 [Candidatus Woesearchaeota archaeon]|nr:hypothetical protein [Candidatus Woesearchaeota archaeon]
MKKAIKINPKSSKEIKPNSKHKITLVFFLVVLLAIIVTASYLTFFNSSSSVQFGPTEEGAGFSYENARALVVALGNDGIGWYCSKTPSFKDSQGNSYGAKELSELKRVLGHEEQLKKELCE